MPLPGPLKRLPFRRRTKAERNPDGTMTLMEHLFELRRRLFFAVLGLFLGAIVGFVWYSVTIPATGVATLGDILVGPYCSVPVPPRAVFNGDPNSCTLLATGPFSILQIRLKAALMAGAVISSPVWLYQLWAFVTPALYNKERRFAVIFVSAAAALMVGGAVLAYVVVSEGLAVLLGFGGDTAVAGLDPDKYFTFLIAMLLIFGVSFELPLLLVMLNVIGAVSGAKLAKARRYSIFGLFVFAGLVVPGNDPITMLALAVALCVLYEVAVQIALFRDKRKAKRLAAEGLGELSDDTASPLPGRSASGPATALMDPIAPPAPVAKPDPVAQPAAPAPQRQEPAVPPPRDLGDAT